MAKYHVNSSGEPGVCSARKNCPFGDLESDHFSTREIAREAYEKHMESASIPLMLLRVYDYTILDDAILARSSFSVRNNDGSTADFESLRNAVDYAKGEKLEIIGVTKPSVNHVADKGKIYGTILNDYVDGELYESTIGPWEYATEPSFIADSHVSNLVKEYWSERFSSWNSAWLNPDEARDRCVDSAEEFSDWVLRQGEIASALDVERDGETHTVTVLEDSEGNEVIIDFTQRQFDCEAPVPYCAAREEFLSDGNWEILHQRFVT